MTDTRIQELVEQAFDYRGHVTVERHDGSTLVGFIYDRGPAYVEMFDETATNRIRVAIEDIAHIALTGDDSAARAQRSWERRHGTLESRLTSVWGEWQERATLFLVALPIELHGIASVLGARARGATASGMLGDDRVIARAVGVGGGAAQVIAAERPRLVISCGFSGALEPSLRPGDLVLASSVCDETGERVPARERVLRVARDALGSRLPLTEGEILCATRVAATRDDKRALARPGLLAVDLESWPAARAAERAQVPWLALRVVLDPLDSDLPAFAGEARSSYSAAAVRHALRGPRHAIELVRLGIRASIAMRSLGVAVRALTPVLDRLAAAEVRE